jgi:integrase
MNQPAFSVNRFENRNGIVSWRVDGRLNGLRIRRNFKSQEEAAAEKATLDIKAAQIASGRLNDIATALTSEQVHDAEAAFRRIENRTLSLLFCVEYALTNYRGPQTPKLLKDGVADYVAAKEHELAQDQISKPQMARIRWELKRLVDAFPKKLVADFNAKILTEFLEKDRPGMKTHNNRRGILSTFFKYAFQRDWIADNPILKVPHYRIRKKRGGAQTFTVEQARTLMEAMETYQGGIWVPYFALCLFAGIRPAVPDGEITKLQPAAVDLDARIITISAEVSKVREARKVTIQPNLAAWLRAYPLDKFPIVLGNFKKRRQKFAKQFNLTHDVLRHTFISMFVAKFRSLGEAAIQAGNSEAIIRKHYLDLKSVADGDAFWRIMPKHAAAVPAPRSASALHLVAAA